MIHPGTRVQSTPDRGLGVFATEFLPQGTILWAQDPLDSVYEAREWEVLPSSLRAVADTYCWVDALGRRVLCWDHGRHVNHACDPNTLTSPWGFEVALRDIEPGEEITDDYGLFNILEPLDCACGAPRCRGRIGPAGAKDMVEDWDHRLAASLPQVARVAQPLREVISREILEEVERRARGSGPWPSVACRLRPT
ncbi:MAG: SET domain-containing protein-lysine N-methyltransferase [Fibrobacteria bacterium]|nr:SET domain-containing protein-lysine N-methyltransferase [Fibrobacteria bacterium]